VSELLNGALETCHKSGTMFKSVLIANRGEIACRIARTAKRLGMRVIAVCSEADRDAPHVRMADEHRLIGPAPAQESYLRADRIIAAAQETGAACIHPGYGFLSENPGFAEACATAGIIFVGPPASAIRAMGLKDAAKELMAKAGVPVVPGYQGGNQTPDFLAEQARKTGFPVMIKAIAGGGGKGMRRVNQAEDFRDALASCQREAKSSFGDDRVLIEKYILNPRHIEVQVMADTQGNCIYLFERDCSLQRRHQKVIEEAPAPGMTDKLRKQMGEAAVAGAKAVGYVGAGTVEFIVSGDLRSFYFMEMNTRLQVEHPVTEMITGLDLVGLQFRVAAGETLPVKQSDLQINGHAIEARLYAEDPWNGFLPQSGKLHVLRWPETSAGLRIDRGVESGGEVTPYYDPMIAKLIAHGQDRDAAIAKLQQALCDTTVLGLRTNKRFLNDLLSDGDFAAGRVSTGLIDNKLSSLLAALPERRVAAEAALAWIDSHRGAPKDVWNQKGWSLAGLARSDRLNLTINGNEIVAIVHYNAGWQTHVAIDGEEFAVLPEGAVHYNGDTDTLYYAAEGLHLEVRASDILGRGLVDIAGGAVTRAPMSGKVIRVLIEEGKTVKRGDPLVILEAMKMEHTLKAGIDGRVATLSASEGLQVKDGDILCVLEPVTP
jgi:3-methylcrotonyl-CoA carboxylase alpha subunit